MSYIFKINYCRYSPDIYREYSINVLDRKKKYLTTVQVKIEITDKTVLMMSWKNDDKENLCKQIIKFIENYDDLDLSEYKIIKNFH